MSRIPTKQAAVASEGTSTRKNASPLRADTRCTTVQMQTHGIASSISLALPFLRQKTRHSLVTFPRTRYFTVPAILPSSAIRRETSLAVRRRSVVGKMTIATRLAQVSNVHVGTGRKYERRDCDRDEALQSAEIKKVRKSFSEYSMTLSAKRTGSCCNTAGDDEAS